MANDTIAITPGAGEDVATSNRSGRQHQQTSAVGADDFAVGIATVGLTTGVAVSARVTRRSILLYSMPTNTGTIYVAPGAATTSSFPILPGGSLALEVVSDINAISDVAAQELRYLEEFDA